MTGPRPLGEGDFEAALLTLREYVGLVERDGTLSWANEAMAGALGRVRSAPRGGTSRLPAMSWLQSDSVAPLMRALAAVETGMTPPGERVSLQLTFQRKDRKPHKALASLQKLEGNSDGTSLLLGRAPAPTGADEQAMLASQIDFLANMSHELRTPLNAILGYAELMTRPELRGDAEQLRDYAEDILDSGRHLRELIEDILEFAKAGSGRISLRIEAIDVERELRACIDVAEGLAVDRELRLELAVDGSLGTIQTDLRLFKQIVLNLLSNAVKFTPKGGRVELGARPNGPWMEVAVRDTGIGIAESEARKVFGAFYQIDGSSIRQQGGLGLGLSIVQRFVELLGGEIRLRSRPGVGSTFLVKVPADAHRVPRDAKGRVRPISVADMRAVLESDLPSPLTDPGSSIGTDTELSRSAFRSRPKEAARTAPAALAPTGPGDPEMPPGHRSRRGRGDDGDGSR